LQALPDLQLFQEVDRAAEQRGGAIVAIGRAGDTGRLIRAPEVRFSCDEIGLDVFGYNIDNRR